MEKEKLSILYSKVFKAREACAGSNVKPKPDLVCLIVDAYAYSETHETPDWIRQVLRNVIVKANDIIIYSDRLPVDDTLCKLLNEMETA